MKNPFTATFAFVGFFYILASPASASVQHAAHHHAAAQRYYEADQALPTTMLTRFVAGTGGVAAPTARNRYVNDEYYHWPSPGQPEELCGGNYVEEPEENHPIPRPTFAPDGGLGKPGPCYAPKPRSTYPGARPGDGQRRRSFVEA